MADSFCPGVPVSFSEADRREKRLAAILVTRAEDGPLRVYTKDIKGRPQPDPEMLAMLAQSIEISNL